MTGPHPHVVQQVVLGQGLGVGGESVSAVLLRDEREQFVGETQVQGVLEVGAVRTVRAP